MARAKEYTYRKFCIILKRNGYYYIRTSGDHNIYSNGKFKISIPNHGKQLNRMVCRRLIKENELIDSI